MKPLFVPAGGPYPKPTRSVRSLMMEVLLALLPCVVAVTWVFGPAVPLQLAWCLVVAWLIECACLAVRGRPILPTAMDGSALLAGALFALCLPPTAPWWIAVFGLLVAIGLAKHLFGGLGHNLFNPAMAGYAAALISFPAVLAVWPAHGEAAPGWNDALGTLFRFGDGFDMIAQATPLDAARALQRQGLSLGEVVLHPHWQTASWESWRTIALATAAGGVWLAARRLIPWQTPAAVLLGVIATSGALHGWDGDTYASPWMHLASGGTVLAACFIATDPVTGCTSPRGRWIFGIGVGAITVLIRQFGLYPDGVAFAVLMMNAAAPWIDLHTRPRILGEPR